jgi:hypothetical protein
MPDHEVRRLAGGRPIIEVSDLAIGSAYAHLQNADERLGPDWSFRFGMVDEAQRFLARKNGNGAHGLGLRGGVR